MLTILPQVISGATDLMAIFLCLSGVGMLVVMLASTIYVVSITTGGTSITIDAGLAVSGLVLSKAWMTAAPQAVGVYNCLGGVAATAFAAAELLGNRTKSATGVAIISTAALLGAVSLSGSIVACTKLNGFFSQPLLVVGRPVFGLLAAVAALAVGVYVVFAAQTVDASSSLAPLLYLLIGSALLLGVPTTLAIGTGHLPLLISIYNGFTGLAVGLEGFVQGSPMLIIAGMAIGAARVVLTLQMTKRRDPRRHRRTLKHRPQMRRTVTDSSIAAVYVPTNHRCLHSIITGFRDCRSTSAPPDRLAEP